MNSRRWDIALALLFFVAAVVALVWWIPNDTETGVIYEDRYSVEIGDAMAPTMVAIAIAIVSLAIGLSACFRRNPAIDPNDTETAFGISAENVRAMLIFATICVVSMALMVWSGSALVAMMRWFGSDVDSYRQLSDTVPYKYFGFAMGGLVMVSGLIAWVDGKLSWRAVGTAVATVTALIIVYDLPFDSLLLPPNGSQ